MEDMSNSAYELGQAIGSTVVLFWVFVIGVTLLLAVLLAWFIWTMARIKQECIKTNRLLSDIINQLPKDDTRNRMIQGPSTSEELAKYKALLDQGAITEKEYLIKKIHLLNK